MPRAPRGRQGTWVKLFDAWWTSDKMIALKQEAGSDGVLAMMRLWSHASVHYPEDGIFRRIKPEGFRYIYTLESTTWEKLLDILVDVGLLDRHPGNVYGIRNWEHNQPGLANSAKTEKRSKKASKGTSIGTNMGTNMGTSGSTYGGTSEVQVVGQIDRKIDRHQKDRKKERQQIEREVVDAELRELKPVEISHGPEWDGGDITSMADLCAALQSWGYIVPSVTESARGKLRFVLGKGDITPQEQKTARAEMEKNNTQITNILAYFIGVIGANRNKKIGPKEWIPEYARI